MATDISHTHTFCGMGMRDANISPGMRYDNSSPYICEIIYSCESGKRDDNIHMKRYCNVYVYVYVYLCTSVYIGLCLCVHICILIAGCFAICICETRHRNVMGQVVKTQAQQFLPHPNQVLRTTPFQPSQTS